MPDEALLGRRDALAGLTATALLAAAAPGLAQSAPVAGFIGTLVLLPLADGRRMRLGEEYGFQRPNGERWTVPKGTTVDGASIPQMFWSVFGGPFDGAYRNASVIHDFYCDVRIKPWEDVHRVFLEGMTVAGVNAINARLMYLAVYFGGPRWSYQAIANSQLALQMGARKVQGAGANKRLFAVPAEPPAGQSMTVRGMTPRGEAFNSWKAKGQNQLVKPRKIAGKLVGGGDPNVFDPMARYADLAKQVESGDLSADQIESLVTTKR